MDRNVQQIPAKYIIFPLNQILPCANFGDMCEVQYVGQTVRKFSKWWSAHRGSWNKRDKWDNSDQNGFIVTHEAFHCILNKPSNYDSYAVTFVEQTSF